jgi:hypothetical protein
LFIDNAPYHHKRELGSLGSKTKKELVDIGSLFNVEYLDLPYDEYRCDKIISGEAEVKVIGDFFAVLDLAPKL